MARRTWLLLPPELAILSDVALTLAGQPAAYWSGDRGAVVEANSLAYSLLAREPALFLAVALGWGLLVGVVLLVWRHRASWWVALLVTFGHALGASSWLVGLGPWGWVAAVGYLAVVAELAWWCARRASGAVPEA